MSNDQAGAPTRVIRFGEGEPTSVTPAETRVETARADPPRPQAPTAAAVAEPVRKSRDLRPWLLGGSAIALGIVAALFLSPDREDQARTSGTPNESRSPEVRLAPSVDRAAAEPTGGAAVGPYRDPDAASVQRALLSVRSDYAGGGLTAVTRQSRSCFNSLAQAPSYVELDYCLAYDAYGAALARRLAAGQSVPVDAWFAETDARAQRTVRSVVGESGDASARLLDIRRLTVEVAETNPVAGATPRPRATEAEAPSAPVVVQRAPQPRPAPIASEPQVAQAPEPLPAPRAPIAQAAAEPAPRARPSFNCRYARSTAEQMVCSDPVLAAADWRLHNVFERAMADTADRRRLRAEQDRWLAARESAAPDPRAVLQVYETRIDELSATY